MSFYERFTPKGCGFTFDQEYTLERMGGSPDKYGDVIFRRLFNNGYMIASQRDGVFSLWSGHGREEGDPLVFYEGPEFKDLCAFLRSYYALKETV